MLSGKWLIEIKCPYSARNEHQYLEGKPQSCLAEVGMAMSQAYYTQVQGQLLITGKEYCDFVIWTPIGIVIDHIYQDFNFTEKLLRKLTLFYVDYDSYDSRTNTGAAGTKWCECNS